MRKPRLAELLKFKSAKGPGYEISPNFYLSVMAAQMPLPSIKQVVEPKGANGAITGFGVPMRGDKDDLDLPMERGAYVIASLDRKTVIEGLVVSKEEAGFNPDSFLKNDLAMMMSLDARERMSATWMLVQLRFKSYDPAVHPAVRFAYEVGTRLADLTGGLLADPVSQVYKLPQFALSPLSADGFAVQDFVAVHSKVVGNTFGMYTLGMQKFGLPEFEMTGVSEDQAQAAARLMLSLGHGFLKGRTLKLGDSVGSKHTPFRIAAGGLDRSLWEGVAVLEVISENTEDINTLLAKWEDENK